MKKTKSLLFVFVGIFFIGGCASSNISYENEQLNLRINQSQLQLHGKSLAKQSENFSTLFIDRNLLRLDDGSTVVYEYGWTDLDYEFEPTAPRTIAIVFDAKRVDKVYYNALIYGFQVILKDNRVLNMIATQGLNQRLQIIYGMSTEKLNAMLKELDPNAQPAYYRNVIDLRNESSPFLAKWTTWKVHILPLVIPIRRRGLF